MAINITFTDGVDQPEPIMAPTGQQHDFTDATSGQIVLNAVNRMLEGIGEMPLHALNPGCDSLAGDAQRILEETTKQIMVERWHCNTLAEQTFTAGSDGKVALAGVLSFTTQNPWEAGRYTVVDGYLYDRTNATATFTVGETVTLKDVVLDLAFAALPEPLRRYITTFAAVRFSQTKQGDKETLRFLYSTADEARRAALRFDGDQRQLNLLHSYDNYRITGAIIRPL